MKLITTTFWSILFIGSIHAQCTAGFTAAPGANNSVSFTNTSMPITVNTTFSWDFGDSQTSSTTNPVHTYSSPGIYYVCLNMLVVDSANFCQNTYCDTVIVGPTAISEVSDGHDAWQLFPNPATNEININVADQPAGAQFIIADIGGRELMKGFTQEGKIDISSFDKGTYLLSVISDDGRVSTKIFVRN